MSRVNGVTVDGRAAAVRELLRQRAVATGLAADEATPEAVERAIEALLEREVPTPQADEAECRRLYERHAAEFEVGELVYARHILFAVTPGVDVAALRALAEKTLRDVQAHPQHFAERARELSNCPSRQNDGQLGQLARGECAPEFERAVFGSTQTGVLPQLVNSRHGFHIVFVDGRVAGRRLPFEQARPLIAARLAEAAAARALTQYVSVLAGEAQLEEVELAAATSPLVQ